MTTLPKSLNHCYDRLMEDIDESNHGIAQKALTWLLFSARPLTLAELAEAIMVKSTEPYFVAAERFDDENCILTIIPAGFVRLVFDDRSRSWNYMHSKELVQTIRRGYTNGKSFQSSPTVQLAHQSVKDYLLSSRISGQRFIIKQTSARNLMREASLGYFIHVVQESSLNDMPSKLDIAQHYPFCDYVCTYWQYHFHDSGDHDKIVLQFLATQCARGDSMQFTAGNGESIILARQNRSRCSTGSPCTQCRRIIGRRLHVIQLDNIISLESLNTLFTPGM